MLSRSESIIFVRTLKRSFQLLKTKLFNAGSNHTSFLIQDDHKSKTFSSLNASSHLIPISWMSTYTYIRVTYPDQRWGAKSVIFFGAPSAPYKCQGGQKSEHLDATWHAHVRVGGHDHHNLPEGTKILQVISHQSLKRVPKITFLRVIPTMTCWVKVVKVFNSRWVGYRWCKSQLNCAMKLCSRVDRSTSQRKQLF